MVKFKDKNIQEKYGKQLARLFSPHVEKIRLIEDDVEFPATDPMNERQLTETLEKGENVYWVLTRDSTTKEISRIKPYSKRTVCRNLHIKVNNVDDIFYDFESRL